MHQVVAGLGKASASLAPHAQAASIDRAAMGILLVHASLAVRAQAASIYRVAAGHLQARAGLVHPAPTDNTGQVVAATIQAVAQHVSRAHLATSWRAARAYLQGHANCHRQIAAMARTTVTKDGRQYQSGQTAPIQATSNAAKQPALLEIIASLEKDLSQRGQAGRGQALLDAARTARRFLRKVIARHRPAVGLATTLDA
eukprot:TRINITY_DN60944_c0_g1_i1.p2 TRINITY_DN60944_c0_g1~~TRINITY_DN60944_c0_g1_i1.p2  ORF type:complete len:200 (-),score=18.88 TRINITY_DN60944_c0_g1_i1:87-686(-)